MIDRRSFLASALVPFAAPAAEQREFPPERVEKLVPGPKPAIALNHLGFYPDARKLVIYRLTGGAVPTQFTLKPVGSYPSREPEVRNLVKMNTDFGPALMGDFSNVTIPGMYQVQVADELSVQFFIRQDIYKRTLPKAVSYHQAQRCGVAVPGVHPVCHLDDARRRDNGQYVDLTGGWHDAGDLRKWMTATMMNGFGLLHLARALGDRWDDGVTGVRTLLAEMRWGNRYFLKMQDADGRIWADVAGGLNGDNSDNHWTDNQIGTTDDRYLNPDKSSFVAAMWTALQGMVAQAFRATDPGYAQACLAAALKCWIVSQPTRGAAELSWWILAAIELHKATRKSDFAATAASLALQLMNLQERQFVAGQKLVRGFWRASAADPTPYNEAVYGAMPVLALLELQAALPQHQHADRWRDALKLHIDEYVVPQTLRSPYRIVPFGLFYGTPTKETYRPLAGELTYRFFMPIKKQSWWAGLSSLMASYAAALANAARVFNQPGYRNLGIHQLEWLMGANPFGACLMTGEGMRNVYPHSRFVGLLNGGIVNGIAGNADDIPVLDTEYGGDWRTTEYWSPHNAFYLWAVSELERA